MRRRHLIDAKDLVLCMADIRGDSDCTGWLTGRMRECPHVVSMYTVRGDEERVFIVFALPPERLWWVTMQSERPQVIGARSVELTFLDNAWPSQLYLPASVREGSPPCGAKCETCPQYKKRCSGCPSSSMYVGDPESP